MKYAIAVLMIIVLSLSTAFAEDTYKTAVKAYLQKDYQKAVELLKGYISEKPDARAYYLIGYAYYKMNKLDEANNYFKEAYLIDPELNTTALMRELGTEEQTEAIDAGKP